MALQWLFAVVYVAVVCAVAGAISWVLRRLGIKPSFLACVVIALFLMSVVAANVAMLLAPRRSELGASDKSAEVSVNSPVTTRP
jgi:hypothetical protein